MIVVEVEKFVDLLLLFTHLKNDAISEIRRDDLGCSWIFFEENLFILVCCRMASVIVRSCIGLGKSLRPNLHARQVSGACRLLDR